MTGGVVVAGIGRSGAATLVEAIGVIDPMLRVTRDRGGDLSLATVGLLVIDPSSVVGDGERDLLDRIRAEIGVAAVVCTKVDAFWDWPTIAKASRRVLDPTEALPMFAVSAAAAVAGAADESGVDELVRWLREHTDDDPERIASRAAAARGAVLREIESRPTGRPPTADELAATRTRLLRSRDRGRTDRLGALRGGLNRVRSTAVAELDAGLREIGARSQDAVSGLRRDDVDDHAAWLDDAVTDLRGRLADDVRDDLERIRSVALLGVEPVSASPAPVPTLPPITPRPRVDRRRSAEDALVVVFGASVGIGFGRLVVTPLAQVDTLQWISMPLALVVGVAVAAVVVRVRRTAALRASVRAWTSEALTESRAAIERDVIGQITAAEPVIAGQVMRHYERRARMIADDVTRVDVDMKVIRSVGAGTRTVARASE